MEITNQSHRSSEFFRYGWILLEIHPRVLQKIWTIDQTFEERHKFSMDKNLRKEFLGVEAMTHHSTSACITRKRQKLHGTL